MTSMSALPPRGALQRGMTYEHVGCDARGAGRG